MKRGMKILMVSRRVRGRLVTVFVAVPKEEPNVAPDWVDVAITVETCGCRNG